VVQVLFHKGADLLIWRVFLSTPPDAALRVFNTIISDRSEKTIPGFPVQFGVQR